ncbi:MAM and LDL-receptor class A domain-containing protein [Elysia marginata]|uniref:MAM and LDL-receptor class A domain-containing protein n=1 Tax=Elysia marginata TaxID=1093978 RepID=A0AAV4FAD0_9GAST|nr:MAM and LDL-receptor class A domain-containing protein [Elysia marginata]
MEGPSLFAVFLLLAFTVASSAQNLDCDFENGFCSWNQAPGAKRDWSRMKGSTFTTGTGPSRDHTTGSERPCLAVCNVS